MQYAEIRAAFSRARQLRHIKRYGHEQATTWCIFLDALVDHMQWPTGLYAPGLESPGALAGVFAIDETGIFWGEAKFIVQHDDGRTSVLVRFGIARDGNHDADVWEILNARAKLIGKFKPNTPDENGQLLQDASHAVLNDFLLASKSPQ